MTRGDNKKLYVGLDMGTTSVGWAATDENYQPYKVGGQPTLGVRLFEEAQPAKERRVKRANKVRMARVKYRLTLLQELLSPYIQKVDKLFFKRLQASAYWQEDKQAVDNGLDLNSLFADNEFKDKNFFAKFDTVYHLRHHLQDEKNYKQSVPDIRLVYLACHHILKNRGHFLYETEIKSGQNFDVSELGVKYFEKLNAWFDKFCDSEDTTCFAEVSFDISDFNKVLDVLKDDKKFKKVKLEELCKITIGDRYSEKPFKDTKKIVDTILKSIIGSTVKLVDLFVDRDGEFFKDAEIEKLDFEQASDKLEKDIEKLQSILNEDEFALISLLKDMYDWAVLVKLLKGKTSISQAMKDRFDSHHTQLSFLKALTKSLDSVNSTKLYYDAFRKVANEHHNYASFIGSNLLNGTKSTYKKSTQEQFYEFIKKVIFKENIKIDFKDITVEDGDIYIKDKIGKKFTFCHKDENHEEYSIVDCFKDMSNNLFLSKLRSGKNGTIPHQVHQIELDRILSLSQEYGLIDKEVDIDCGMTIKDKIMSILTFRVPYYVGRTNPKYKDDKSKKYHVWIERNEENWKLEKANREGKRVMTPWNFDSVVDKEKSGEQFIKRMLGTCTYIREASTLPKHSLLYAKFAVLNEINNIRIDDERIPFDLKQRIFNELFKKQKTVREKEIKEYLKKERSCDDIKLSGFDTEGKGGNGLFKSTLSSYIQAKQIFDDIDSNQTHRKVVEFALLRHALHTDKDVVYSSIKKEYPNLGEECYKKLKKLNFSGFGKLSEEFLNSPINGEFIDKSEKGDGRPFKNPTIIQLLWETEYNLMELINHDDFGIKAWLDSKNKVDQIVDFYDDLVKQSYAAPSVKRSVWQAMKVVDELVEYLGKSPDGIFIEVTREVGEKERKESRKSALKKLKLDKSILEQLEKQTDEQLRGERLYLYYLQNGKCAYSGGNINISELSTGYDIDHIIPQAKLKNDSIKNKVLVKRELNTSKGENYPLKHTNEIWKNKDQLIPMWKEWKKNGLIDKDKFNNLIRTKDLTPKELEGFKQRDIVFTGHSTKAVAELLQLKYEKSQSDKKRQVVVYSKARNVSDFRNKFGLLKSRELNNYHHAHDAYLNIVVGNIWNTLYNKKFYMHNVEGYKFRNPDFMYDRDVEGAWIASEYDEEKRTYEYSEGTTLYQIKKVLKFVNLPVSKKTQTNSGQMFKINVKSTIFRQKAWLSGKICDDKFVANEKAISRKGEGNPLKDTRKYGYYEGIKTAYMMIVEHDIEKGSGKNKKVQRQLEWVPIAILQSKSWDKLKYDKKIEQLKEGLSFKNPKIILEKIPMYSLCIVANMRLRLVGGSLEFHNAMELHMDDDNKSLRYIRLISQYQKKSKEAKGKKIEQYDYRSDKIVLSKKIAFFAGKKRQEIIINKDSNVDEKINRVCKSYNIRREIIEIKETSLVREENVALFEKIILKLKKLYGNENTQKLSGFALPGIAKKLEDKLDTFKDLSVEDQVIQLYNLFVGLGANAEAFDLTKIGYRNDREGRIRVTNKKINYPLTIVKQSITGLKSHKIVVNKLKDEEITVYKRGLDASNKLNLQEEKRTQLTWDLEQ
ncbi:MAG: type II CRISPR RNA-guided endonuclease Cas9 [Clostridiales bacterium]|jgi:CRISPR-associated endonuclease Csn1|nr:type II CRISPR RNA-guided endonuclease Cas9 [Clostridiales bacterium]